MKEKVECPYCGKDINIDTDNWCDEDEVYEYQCDKCGKYCMVCASISWSYDAEKLDCKNGLAEHKYRDVQISSRGHTMRSCKVCCHVEEEEEEK